MRWTTYLIEEPTLPKVVASIDFTDNWPFGEVELTIDGYLIDSVGDIGPFGGWFLRETSRAILVDLDNGSPAVTSTDGLAAYLKRTGQQQ